MSQVEGSYEAAAAYERDQKRMKFGEGGAPTPPATGGQLPRDPGAAFGRMRDEFDRVTANAGAKTEGAKAGPFSADAPLLPGLAILTRKAAERCEAEAKNYRDMAGSQAPTSPVSFIRTLGMVLTIAADTMDDLAAEAE